MPLGDPMGGEEAYVEKGNVKRVWIASVPVKDLDRALGFYVDVLGLPLLVLDRGSSWAEVGTEEPAAKIGLFVPGPRERTAPGTRTGIVLEVDSIFEFHRRLVDEEVPFTSKPEKRAWGGIMASFLDPDGNELTAVEDPEHYRRLPRPEWRRKERFPESRRSCRRSSLP
ncbi:MAG: VOC family protein [Methanomassiliicoccales archaeon]|jgi:catechol 2,3-dioxygenase-like lactoylglutathione lyase family enzyme|nr:VOC family protein [Methanomassiliicoccales archaeon]